MKHTKKPAQSMCGFLCFHTLLPYSINLSLAIIGSYNITFHTSLAAKSIDIKIKNKPLFNTQNQHKLYAYNFLLTKQLQNNISKGA